jgi:TIR domain
MAIDIFISYAADDAAMRNELVKHLASLQQSGKVRAFYDRLITPGEDFRSAIHREMERARIILLLVSPDFLHSQYRHGAEMRRALERQRAGTATVIPIVLRPCDWQDMPFEGLWMLPAGAVPVTSERWRSRDKAWMNVVLDLRAVVDSLIHGVMYSPPPSRSFVAMRGGAAATPFPGTARSPLPSHRVSSHPVSSHPNVTLAPMHAPVRAPAPTRKRAPTWAIGAIGLVAALIGLWAMLRDRGSEELQAPLHQVPPAATPISTPPRAIVVPSPAPAAPPPAPAACCGGIHCSAQDIQESICTSTPGRCASCASGRDYIAGACHDPLAPSRPFHLRLSYTTPSWPSATQVCVRLSGTSGWTCTSAANAADLPSAPPGAGALTDLTVTPNDLLTKGLDIDVRGPRLSASKTGAVLSGSYLKQSALCVGVGYDLPSSVHVALYLDDP